MAKLFVHSPLSVDDPVESHAPPELDHLPERALLLAGPNDLVCVAHEVEAEYLEYLSELGLGTTPDNILVASRFADPVADTPLWKCFLESEEALVALSSSMRARGTSSLHPFVATQGHFDLATALAGRLGRQLRVLGGDPELVAYADRRHHIRAAAVELGVPVAPGEIVELRPADAAHHHRLLRAAISRHSGLTGRVMIRASSGAAGSATFVTTARRPEIDHLITKLIARRDNRFYLVESMVEATAVSNVQMHINDQDGWVDCIGVIDQASSSELADRAIVCPSSASCLPGILRWSQTLARWLQDAGYTGLAGFEFVEFSDRDRSKAFFTQLTPHVPEAAYPLAVLKRLASPAAFTSGIIRTGAESFAEMREALPGLLCSPERSTGLLPYATGGLQHGLCGMIALASSREEALELYGCAERTLSELCPVRL